MGGVIPAPNIAELGGEIGRDPLQEYAAAQNLRSQSLQQQEAQQQIQAQKRQFADQDALTKAITQYDPNKNTLADVPKLITQNGGSGQAAINAQQGLVKQKKDLLGLSDEQFAQEQKKADLIQGVHDQVSQAPPEQKQDLYVQGLHQLQAAGVDVSKEPPTYPGDDVFAQHLPAIRLHSAVTADAEKDRELTTKEQTSGAQVSEAATKAKEAETSAQKFRAELPGGPMEAPDKAELRSYLTDPNIPGEMKPPSQRTPASFVAWKAKQSPVAMVMGNQLGPGGQGSALDQAAELYSQTHQLPQGFARSPGTTAAIIKRSAELHPDQSLSGNEASYKADSAALTQVQKQFDTMNAFEGTALKNLDLYAQTAAKIPDLGSRFANIPLRMVTGQMIGSDNMAALNAARQTASAEVAKVLNSSTGSGVLSDTQKKDAQDVIDGNLPFSATMAVVNTLKNDMANRHQSYQADIQAIKGRLGQSSNTQQNTPPLGAQHVPGGAAQGLKEGATGTGSDGKKYVVKGGVWEAQ